MSKYLNNNLIKLPQIGSNSKLAFISKEKILVKSFPLPSSNANINMLKNLPVIGIKNVPTETSKDDKIQNNGSLIKDNEIDDYSFTVDNLQQLSTNALPPYTPPTPPHSLQNEFKNSEVHSCCDCGDSFMHKSSLTFHLERRSVLIKFFCETCKNNMIFYNRCSLLSHIRAHADKGEPANIEKATVNVIPRILMDGIQTEVANNLDDEFNSLEDMDVPPTELLEFSLKEIDDEISDNANKNKENDISLVKVKCQDCDEEFNSIQERKTHYTNDDKIPVGIVPCSQCKKTFPSKCSLKAHQRIHLQISPYICPECGDSPDPYWNNFQHHLTYSCFHFARSMGYKCPECNLIAQNTDVLKDHIDHHIEKFLKCDSCTKAFKTTLVFNSHSKLTHAGDAKYKIIIKCPFCEVVCSTPALMDTHKSIHIKNMSPEYIFSCMQCGKALESKLKLLEHLKDSHPKTYKVNITDKTTTKNMPVSTLPLACKRKVECLLCHCTFLSHQGYCVHMARTHVYSKIPCSYCYVVMPNRKEMVNHGKKHLMNGGIVCLLCHNKRFEDKGSLDAHLLNHAEGLKFSSFCPICDQGMESLAETMNHLRNEHLLKTENKGLKLQNSGNIFTAQVSCHFCRNPFESESALNTHLINHHHINIGEKRVSIASEESESKKKRSEGNTCAKCDFKSENRQDFKTHILSHKTDKNSYQCQECGLCFVLEGSLCKHLKIHKIEDVKKYISEEGTNYVPELEKPAETTTRNALECSVCFTAFASEASLKTHMRSHGMAFIQAKKSLAT